MWATSHPAAMEKIIIGIDPGTIVTGYSILKMRGNIVQPLDFGCIRPRKGMQLSDRCHVIFSSLLELIDTFSPAEMALETQFFYKNGSSALKLAMAMAACMLAGKTKKLKVFGYSPREVKCSIVGTGKASKEQMQLALMRFLSLKQPPMPHDATDAIGIALCHINSDSTIPLGKLKNKEL